MGNTIYRKPENVLMYPGTIKPKKVVALISPGFCTKIPWTQKQKKKTVTKSFNSGESRFKVRECDLVHKWMNLK